MADIILQIFKFGAILIGMISGAIGTLTDTRDKTTGLPTPWSRRLAAMIIVSGMLAIVTQAVESYIHNESERVEKHQRQLSDERVAMILEDARLAASGIADARRTQDKTLSATQETVSNLTSLQVRADQLDRGMRSQQKTLRRTVGGVQVTARSIQTVLSAQGVQLEALYRLTHPLPIMSIVMVLRYPIDDQDSAFEPTWIKRVQSTTGDFEVAQTSPLEPEVSEPSARWLLRTPEFHFTLNNPPFETRGGYPHMAENTAQRTFKTVDPWTNIHVTSPNLVEVYVEAKLVSLRTDPNLVSLRDLYGSELLISIPHGVPKKTSLVSCQILFGGRQSTTQILELSFSDNDRLGSASYAKILTEAELGVRPLLNQ